MSAREVLDRIVDLLDGDDVETVNTSMRLPAALRDAAALAVEHLGVSASTTTLAAGALRTTLETVVMEAALEERFRGDPTLRPSLGDVAVALAEIDGLEIASEPEAIRQAAEDVLARHPDAAPDDVLLWVEAQLAVA